ncbi:putative RRP45-exosome complex exonuclease [Serendipita vermifera]|nr:putative RRP45-exosome complex exonuclease [Serendipita vermifera]
MPRSVSPSINEKEFLVSALQQSLRLDGRSMGGLREPQFTFGPDLGWVECAMGKTRVLAAIDAKMVKPASDRPYEGMINIVSEISPMASSEYEQGRTSDMEVTITRMLDKVLRRSDALDKESLCVVAGQRVWSLRITFHFLADAGNMLDCACLAGIVALRHFRKPEVEVEGEEVIIHSPESRAPAPLAIHHSPICFTFALYSFQKVQHNPSKSSSNQPSISTVPSGSFSTHQTFALLDPILLEETLAHGTLSIALNAQSELCVLQKNGGVPLDQEEILRLIEVAVERAKEIEALIERRLKEDWEQRTVEIR